MKLEDRGCKSQRVGMILDFFELVDPIAAHLELNSARALWKALITSS